MRRSRKRPRRRSRSRAKLMRPTKTIRGACVRHKIRIGATDIGSLVFCPTPAPKIHIEADIGHGVKQYDVTHASPKGNSKNNHKANSRLMQLALEVLAAHEDAGAGAGDDTHPAEGGSYRELLRAVHDLKVEIESMREPASE